MYWPFDSRNHPNIYDLWLDWHWVWKEEILNGYHFGIPLCCIVWYLITVYLCLLTRGDRVILPLMFGRDGWERFLEYDYYRCPLCSLRGRIARVKWPSCDLTTDSISSPQCTYGTANTEVKYFETAGTSHYWDVRGIKI